MRRLVPRRDDFRHMIFIASAEASYISDHTQEVAGDVTRYERKLISDTSARLGVAIDAVYPPIDAVGHRRERRKPDDPSLRDTCFRFLIWAHPRGRAFTSFPSSN